MVAVCMGVRGGSDGAAGTILLFMHEYEICREKWIKHRRLAFSVIYIWVSLKKLQVHIVSFRNWQTLRVPSSFFIICIRMEKHAGLLTFILRWIFHTAQLFLVSVWRFHSGGSSGCSSGRMEVWRFSTWRGRMKACTPALQRTTGARPTARALCRLQVSSN